VGHRQLVWIVSALVVLGLAAQLVGPARTNPATDPSVDLLQRRDVLPRVTAIIERSCLDCHSNRTTWPWYAHVAPVSWFVIGHVNEGRDRLNLSRWGAYSDDDQDDMLKNISKEVRSGGMPLDSYLWLHRGARLSADDVKALASWADAERGK
jgi:hypothetical protein